MQDYGKAQQLMHLQGKAWNTALPKPPPRLPEVWDSASTGREWDAVMMRLGFDATLSDEPRWVYSNAPKDNSLGVTIIIYFKDGRWQMDFCVDTLATQNSADWDTGIEALDHCTTPFTVARWAKEHVQELLEMALKALLGKGVS